MNQEKTESGRNFLTAPVEISAGGVVIDCGQVVVVQHLRGDWVMPKGHLEAGESPEEAATREVKEETNLAAGVLAKIGRTEYDFRAAGEDGVRHKVVHWFLMQVNGNREDLRAVREEGMAQALWMGIDEAYAKLTFDADRDILRKGWLIFQERGGICFWI